MLTLADILSGFTLNGQRGVYESSILNFTNFGTVYGIPGSPISYLSFAYVGWLRKRFSTKTLWLVKEYINLPSNILIYFFGMARVRNSTKIAKGITYRFMDLWPMIGAYAVQNSIAMTMYGVGKVVPNEIRNECIDYGEWKSGFRAEAMTGVLRGMPYKLTALVGNSMTNIVLKLIGFRLGEDYLNQTEYTAKGIFAMATLIPELMGLVTLIPKLLYNINQKDRERMYIELGERRAATAAMAMEINGS